MPRHAPAFGGLAHGEVWQEPMRCKGRCRTTLYMRIVSETARRIHLRCPDCGSGRYVENTYYPNTGQPAPTRRVDLDHDLALLAAEYASGLSMNTLRTKYHCGQGTIHNRLQESGVTIRPSGTPVEKLRPSRQRAQEISNQKRERARLLREEGLTFQQIADELGTTWQYAKRLAYQGRRRLREAVLA